MEDKRELTKELLAGSLRDLMMTTSFKKITIKMITDGANVIRPTFYKHFQDKYEVLEWIFQKEVIEKIEVLIENNMEDEVIRLLCKRIGANMEFYRQALKIEGPNSLYQIMNSSLYRCTLKIIKKHMLLLPKELDFLTVEQIARFYTTSLTSILYDWILNDSILSSEQMVSAYNYLTTKSIHEMINECVKKSL